MRNSFSLDMSEESSLKQKQINRKKFAIDTASQAVKPLIQILKDNEGIVPDYMLE